MNTNTRRCFLKNAGLILTSWFLGGCSVQGESFRSNENTDQPNVVLIMTDDQGWGDVHSHGNNKIDTPQMDGLAEEGARFDRFFVSPVSAPTRASLLTGRYHLRTGAHGVTGGRENVRSEEVTLAELFKSNGYKTGCFGKWHNGAHFPNHPNGQGFDEFVGFCAGHWNRYFNTKLEHNGIFFKTEGYITDVLTDFSLSFINKNKQSPFFCYIPYNIPHAPWQVPKKYFTKYKRRDLDDKTACAYGMCENFDDNLGRILNALSKNGLSENTIVLFLSDNGPNSYRYNGNMKGKKGSVHEGGVRVPLFIRWPKKIQSGTIVYENASHIDLLPTLSEMCGLSTEKCFKLDGRSLVPLLRSRNCSWQDRIIFTFPRGPEWSFQGAARTRRWRAVKKKDKWLLFDIHSDPHEDIDVSKHYPEVLKKLSSEYTKLYKEMAEEGFKPLPISVGYPSWDEVELPAHEATLEGEGIAYKGKNGWAHDWIADWTSVNSFAVWDIDVVESGSFKAEVKYICSRDNTGCKIKISAGNCAVQTEINEAFDPEPFPHRDLLPRKEVYDMPWKQVTVGTLNLSKGRQKLKVLPLAIKGREFIELKALLLKRID
ncbi:arylsulfatase [Sedimentisphaera salicampi]|uniref:Arylsulfatase n=1 Tax=Sedimentisphaera salicampi TaxID=1941349 RepID=A0A1W6LKV9_9BACT|nr:arylsulfatase [Sedimentisphaera salicampi]ARN56430.1 Arylsulfatase [Sedimentisphaera salicampi]OXU15315.1 Arylsulfatase [Sedimentisphaera salicampi]